MPGTVNSTPIGVEGLVIALLIDETLKTYGAVTPVSPLINIKIAPNSNTDILYADNIAVETVTTIGKIDVEMETQDLPLAVQAVILGHALDTTNGVMVYNESDIAPYLALGFKIKKANGKYRYVWLLKGKFEELEMESKTQEDKVTFQTPKLKGTFVIRADGSWKYAMDEDSATTPIATFLNTVFSPVII